MYCTECAARWAEDMEFTEKEQPVTITRDVG